MQAIPQGVQFQTATSCVPLLILGQRGEARADHFFPEGLRKVAVGVRHRSGVSVAQLPCNHTTTSYLWCGGKPCQARDTANTPIRSYYSEGEYLPGSPAQTLYYGVDQTGTVRRVFESASSAPAYDYGAYGSPLQATAPVTDFTYAGLFTNANSGLDLANDRVYDPTIGRWLSRDPLGAASSPLPNLYLYADGNPLSAVDPLGMCSLPFSQAALIGLEIAVTEVALGGPEDPIADGLVIEELNGAGGGAALTSGQLGQAGETAVRGAYDIGPKVSIDINGGVRVPDGLTDSTLSEVKNVAKQSFTWQLRDYLDFSQETGRSFDLYLRPTTRVSRPLQDAIDSGLINRLDIP